MTHYMIAMIKINGSTPESLHLLDGEWVGTCCDYTPYTNRADADAAFDNVQIGDVKATTADVVLYEIGNRYREVVRQKTIS